MKDQMAKSKDREYMQMAIELAEKGRGFVNPNPMVGAVLVKDGQIIGRGFHERYGEPHAERNALKDCTVSPEGATLYVTLEPCCHFGKTPPCTDAILENKIARVVMGAKDPNPKVFGGGIEILKQKGIEVEVGLLEEECRKQNEVFFYYMEKKLPFVVLKYAMTLDGKIATVSGQSKWITGEAAREHAHGLRSRYSAILVGVKTVLSDDPMLNCRIAGGKNPVRIVCDTNLHLSPESKLARSAGEIPTYVACACEDAEKIKELETTGCHILQIPAENGRVSFRKLMEQLALLKIDSVLVEGGADIHFSALESGLVQRVYAYIAPMLIGGDRAKTPIGGRGIEDLNGGLGLNYQGMKALGSDILLEYYRGNQKE